MTSIRRLSLALVCLLAATGGAFAEEEAPRWYRVEVVIFEQRDLSDASMEVWPADPGSPDMAMIGDLKNPPEGFSVTFTDDLELSKQATRLSRSGRYDPILHFAWTQQGLDQRHAIPLRVKGGVIYPPLPAASLPEASPLMPVTPVVVGTEPAQTAADTTAGNGIATTFGIAPQEPVEPEPLHQLDGTLTLVLGRYLHLYTDLIDRRLLAPGSLVFEDEAVPPTYENGQALVSFRVREHRKMRSKELHYIDHPVLGILVKALPVKAPVEETLEPMPKPDETTPTIDTPEASPAEPTAPTS